MPTVEEIDNAYRVAYRTRQAELGVHWLPADDERVMEFSRVHREALEQFTADRNAVVSVAVEEGRVAVDEAGKRVCRVVDCGRVLVKKPGRGRWPVECRVGEGCKE